MSAIKLFQFENLQIRIVTGDDGQPWFVGADVARALGYERPADALATHVPEDDSANHRVIDAIGRNQSTLCINESGVYALIFGSRLESSKAFKRWVTSEVLPSIRQTGAYVAPQVQARALPGDREDRANAILRIGEWLGRVPGVRPEIAAATTAQLLAEDMGLPYETMRRALPAGPAQPSSMNATALGKRVGLSAVKTNARLAELSLQRKNDRGDWELTEAGASHGEAMPYSSNRGTHTGYQVLWRESVLELLRASA